MAHHMYDVTDKGLKVLVLNTVPEDPDGGSAVDLYLRLPAEDHHVRWVKRGDPITETHRKRLRSHADPRLYCPLEHWNDRFKYMAHVDLDPPFGNEVKEMISDLYLSLFDNEFDSTPILEKLIYIANEISELVAKDTKAFEAKALEELKDASRLEMSYAIRSIATIFCIANDFASRKSIYDLTTAILYMDIGLNDFSNSELEKIWKKEEDPNSETLASYRQHPSKAHLIAQERIKAVNDTGLQIILNHHEYNNKEGFPRGVHTKALIDHVKIVSLAVDVWEILKVAEITKQVLSFEEALILAAQTDIEAHKRRHSGVIIGKIFKHLNLKAPKALTK